MYLNYILYNVLSCCRVKYYWVFQGNVHLERSQNTNTPTRQYFSLSSQTGDNYLGFVHDKCQ